MSINDLARLYVDFLEPTLRFLGIAIFLILVLAMLNILRDGKKKGELLNSAFSFIIKMVTKSITFLGHALLWMAKATLKIITVIYASFRDFFISKI